jgi:DNA-binding MarR family transcriptional regulator/GNAT superfamily N-acetyltransferase
MSSEAVATIRQFNRTVTQRVGALEEAYLSRDRSLGQARVLWEIGPREAGLASLRARMGLDAGYLSRLLRSLEAEGLVVVEAESGDARQRLARLTEAGRAEWSILDERSDDLARSILRPLSPGQRQRLVAAMDEVQQLLVASMIKIEVTAPEDPHARFCLRSYFAELAVRFDEGFDPALSISADDLELTLPAGVLLLATINGEPVGCGALKFGDGAVADVKRMWIAPSSRGLGLGRRLLGELEWYALERNVRTLRLETNHSLDEAMHLYRSSGYREVAAFSDEAYAHHWFEKRLSSRKSVEGGRVGEPQAGA